MILKVNSMVLLDKLQFCMSNIMHSGVLAELRVFVLDKENRVLMVKYIQEYHGRKEIYNAVFINSWTWTRFVKLE